MANQTRRMTADTVIQYMRASPKAQKKRLAEHKEFEKVLLLADAPRIAYLQSILALKCPLRLQGA